MRKELLPPPGGKECSDRGRGLEITDFQRSSVPQAKKEKEGIPGGTAAGTADWRHKKE